MSFNQLAPFILGLQKPSNSKTRLSGLNVQRHEERKQSNNTVAYEAKKTERKKKKKKKEDSTTWVPPVCVHHGVYNSLNTGGMGRKSTGTLHTVRLGPF